MPVSQSEPGMVWQMMHVPLHVLDLTEDSLHLCHEKTHCGNGHWWSYQLGSNGMLHIFDCLAKKYKLLLSLKDVLGEMDKAEGLTFFSLQRVPLPTASPSGPEYNLIGAVQDVISPPRSSCALCEGSLCKAGSIEAHLFTLHGVVPVTHERFRCTMKLCRAYSYYKYVVAHNRKSNSIRPVDAKYIFVTANTGFCVQFLNYHEALQFCGSLSDMAVSWAQATTMWDSQMDMQTERSWRERYAEARLLWNVMQEMVEMTGNKPDATKTLYSINIASRLVKHVVS